MPPGFGRFWVSELTPERIAAAALRRARDVPHRLAWHFGPSLAVRNRDRLGQWAGRHAGQRCFILGSGPSLAKMDLRPLASEITFGLNRIYLLFPDLPFQPTYYCATNELVLANFASEIRALGMPRFLNWNQRGRFDDDDFTLFVKDSLSLRDSFEGDPLRPSSFGGTVTYTALQLAYFMGFQQVILIGVDHFFAESGTPNRSKIRTTEVDESHCHPNYFPQGVRWQLPDLRRSELAYGLARRAFERAGREVLDATVGGHLQVFEKIAYESLFEDHEFHREDEQ